jgi:hypothetical protein
MSDPNSSPTKVNPLAKAIGETQLNNNKVTELLSGQEKADAKLKDPVAAAVIQKKEEDIIKTYKLKEGDYRIQVKVLEASDLVPK